MCGEPSASHDSLARGILEGGVGNQGAKPLDLGFGAAGGPGGPRPLPRAVPAMNGQLGFSRNRRHPSPDRDPPRAAAVTGREPEDRRSKQAPGRLLDPGRGRSPGSREGRKAQPAPDPAPARCAGGRARGNRDPSAPGAAREGREPPSPGPRPYLFFHVP